MSHPPHAAPTQALTVSVAATALGQDLGQDLGHGFGRDGDAPSTKASAMAVLKTLVVIAAALVLPAMIVLPLRGILPGEISLSAASPALLATLFVSQLAMGLGALAMAMSASAPMREHMGFAAPRQGWRAYAYAIAAILAATIIINLVRKHVFAHDVYSDLKMMAPFFRNPLWPLSFVVFAIGAPLAEELLFRGYLLGAFSRTRVAFIIGVALSTGIWAVMHSYSLGGMILVAVMGTIFALMRYLTGSLRVPVAAHAFNNTIACLMLQFGPQL